MNYSSRHLCAVCLAALLAIVGGEGARIVAQGACALGFTITQPVCTVANAADDFSYATEVSWASQNKCAWTILFHLNNPGGGISNHTKSINSVGVSDNCGFNGGVISCTVSGHRDSGTPTSQLNVIEQDDTPGCA